MLTLDTLQWAILDPHPLGFPPPAIHGHTTVEDPARVGRLIVFGGQGGTNWNTQVGPFCGLSHRPCFVRAMYSLRLRFGKRRTCWLFVGIIAHHRYCQPLR